MSFLTGLEKSLAELGRDPEERMLEYLNSPMSPLNKQAQEDDSEELEGNPRSPLHSPKNQPQSSAVVLPNAVESDDDLDDDHEDEDYAVSKGLHEEPLAGHELFDRKMSSFTEEKSAKVNDLTVGDLRGIIRQEVVDKAVEVGMIGGRDRRAGEAGGAGSIDSQADAAVTDPHLTAPRDRLPRNIKEAVPISLPLLYGGLSRASPIRQKCFMICNDKSWNIMFLLFLLANCAYIAFVPDDPNLKEGFWGTFDWACNILYAFEILCNILAYGFIGHNAWFSVSAFHKIDFFILLATAVEVVLATQNVSGLSLKPFR